MVKRCLTGLKYAGRLNRKLHVRQRQSMIHTCDGIFNERDVGKVCCVGNAQTAHAVCMPPLLQNDVNSMIRYATLMCTQKLTQTA